MPWGRLCWKQKEMEEMERDGLWRRWLSKACAGTIALLALAFLSSCASIQTAKGMQTDSPARAGEAQAKATGEGARAGPQETGQQDEQDTHPSPVTLKGAIVSVIITLLSPGTWSTIFQAIAGHGFWP